MKLTLAEVLKELQLAFENHPYVSSISTYKNVAFVEIKTSILDFAVEFDGMNKVELVCRNDRTAGKFSRFFRYPFGAGNTVISDGRVIHPCFVTAKGMSFSESGVSAVAFGIVARCLESQGLLEYWAEPLVDEIRRVSTTVSLDTRNRVLLDMDDTFATRQLSVLETLEVVDKEELSLARFGDGEIKCMVTERNIGFQTHDKRLMRELRTMSSVNPAGLLVSYPASLVENKFWLEFWTQYWPLTRFFLKNDRFGDSFVSRPQAFQAFGQPLVDAWKSLWRGKKICIVTGESSRMDPEHEIFDTSTSSDIILSKNKDAYSDVERIVEECKKRKDVDVFLFALGPAGTVLAYRLSQLGLRGLDVGHLNNSFDNVFYKGPRPEQVEIKPVTT